MVPVSGSAYTYSYATLGELIAWIIGWDLIIEYAIGNVAVAISWANYMNTLLEGFGIKLPPWMTIDYTTAAAKMPQLVAAAPHIFGIPIVFNILAGAIVAAITVVLVWGIRESASFNFGMVAIKLVVLGFFVLVSFKFVKPVHWHPFAPNGVHGVIEPAGFRLRGWRDGFIRSLQLAVVIARLRLGLLQVAVAVLLGDAGLPLVAARADLPIGNRVIHAVTS